MINLSIPQRIYLSCLIAGVIIVLILLLVFLYKNFYKKLRFNNVVGFSLYRYCNLHDYLLLNDYHILLDEKHVGDINHVLITNKSIVIINDFPISGVISGDAFGENLKQTSKKGDRLINNPLNYNRNLTKRVAIFNDLDNSYLKGIVVVLDDAIINVNNVPPQFKICRKKDLKKVIKEFESDEVKPFKEDTVVNFINILNKNNIEGPRK